MSGVKMVSARNSQYDFCAECAKRLQMCKAKGAKFILLAIPKIRLNQKHEGAAVVEAAYTIEEAKRKALREISNPGYVLEILYLDN